MTHKRLVLLFPRAFLQIFIISLPFFFSIPQSQFIHRGHRTEQLTEERVWRHLVDSCDLFDDIDAILHMKEKYSKFELEQVLLEKRERELSLSLENLEDFDKRRIKSNH